MANPVRMNRARNEQDFRNLGESQLERAVRDVWIEVRAMLEKSSNNCKVTLEAGYFQGHSQITGDEMKSCCSAAGGVLSM